MRKGIGKGIAVTLLLSGTILFVIGAGAITMFIMTNWASLLMLATFVGIGILGWMMLRIAWEQLHIPTLPIFRAKNPTAIQGTPEPLPSLGE